MPLVIDDIAAATVAEEVSAEAVETFSEEAASKFSETAFEDGMENAHHIPEADGTAMSEVEHPDTHTKSSIEQEFSPENFNAEGTENLEELSPEGITIERTSTFEEQTVDNIELESQRPEIESKMSLSQEHNGGVLRYNMEQVMETKSDTEVSNAHHIVGRDTPKPQKNLRNLVLIGTILLMVYFFPILPKVRSKVLFTVKEDTL